MRPEKGIFGESAPLDLAWAKLNTSTNGPEAVIGEFFKVENRKARRARLSQERRRMRP